MRDTTLNGATHTIVRDSAVVTIGLRSEDTDYARHTRPVRDQRLAGTLVGTRIVDARGDFSVVVSDTATLRGTVGLTAPGITVPHAPLHVTRVGRGVLARDSAYAALLKRPPRPYEDGNMVQLSQPQGVRLPPMDSAGRRAVLRALARPLPAAERMRLSSRLGEGLSPDSLEREMLRLALIAGDSVWAVERVNNALQYRAHGASLSDYALLRSFIADPARAFHAGVSRNGLFETLSTALLNSPPALSRDSVDAACMPSACRAMAAEYRTAPDTLLRLLGAIARMTMEPARWSDTVIAAASREPALRSAALLARGVGATWPSSPKDPIPLPDAPWQAWLRWLANQPTRFDRSHLVAIAFTERRTGVRYAPAFRQAWRAATNDTARLVYGTMLLGLGERLRNADELVVASLSASPQTRAEAKKEIRVMFGDGGVPADSATATEVGGRLIRILVGTEKRWAYTDSASLRPGWGDVKAVEPASVPKYLVASSLPANATASARGSAFRVMPPGWRLAPGQSGQTIHIGEVRRVGPFVRIDASVSTLIGRSSGRSSGNSYGWTLTLVQRGTEWIIVDMDAWIT